MPHTMPYIFHTHNYPHPMGDEIPMPGHASHSCDGIATLWPMELDLVGEILENETMGSFPMPYINLMQLILHLIRQSNI